ncbi:MAG TPA: histone deacetylase [Ktedonobacterales bacterium]
MADSPTPPNATPADHPSTAKASKATRKADVASTARQGKVTNTSEAASSKASPKASNEAKPARLPSALVYDAAMLAHHVPRGFPEVPERVAFSMRMIEALIENGTLPAEHVLRLPARPATRAELETVHTPAHIERIRAAVEELIAEEGPEAEPRYFTTDVFLSPGSYTAGLLAAGAPLVALDAIGEGQARNGYALVRPPGHHARPGQAMGFCLFNNVAVAARYAQRRWGWRKVLIVDYDVHHGNGTQEMFYEDADVVYFSTHEFPFYPGTGGSQERGAGAGLGATVNVPLPAESGWSVYDPIFRQVLWPVADRFKPDVVLLSAGFDAHWLDPLAQMRLSTADYADLTLEVIEIAERYCEGRVVVVQEGGYHLDVMAQCAATVLVNLTGSDGVVDNLGQPEPLRERWNDEAIVSALYELHDLAGYRRKARREGKRTTPPYTLTEPEAPQG